MAQDFSLISVMLKGGWAIGVLILMSVVVFAVLYDRWNLFRKGLKARETVLASLKPFLNRKNVQECVDACDREGGFYSRIVGEGLRARIEKNDPTQAMEREAKVQLLRYEVRLPLLATIGGIAPFVGLFGTVLGIIRAFRDLAVANAGGAAVVSQGIAEALISTAFGLFVAITAVFIYNSYQARLNRMAQEAEILISEMDELFGKWS